jgi:hypothetical protein
MMPAPRHQKRHQKRLKRGSNWVNFGENRKTGQYWPVFHHLTLQKSNKGRLSGCGVRLRWPQRCDWGLTTFPLSPSLSPRRGWVSVSKDHTIAPSAATVAPLAPPRAPVGRAETGAPHRHDCPTLHRRAWPGGGHLPNTNRVPAPDWRYRAHHDDPLQSLAIRPRAALVPKRGG